MEQGHCVETKVCKSCRKSYWVTYSKYAAHTSGLCNWCWSKSLDLGKRHRSRDAQLDARKEDAA